MTEHNGHQKHRWLSGNKGRKYTVVNVSGTVDGWTDVAMIGVLRCKHLGGIQVSGVCHGSGVVAVVPVFDDRVKEVSKHLEGTANNRGEGATHFY